MITSLSQQNLELLLNRSNAVVVFFLVLLNDPDIMRKIYRKNKKLYQHVYSFALYPEDNQPSSKMYADWLLSRKNLDNMMNETTSHSAYLPKHTNANCIFL